HNPNTLHEANAALWDALQPDLELGTMDSVLEYGSWAMSGTTGYLGFRINYYTAPAGRRRELAVQCQQVRLQGIPQRRIGLVEGVGVVLQAVLSVLHGPVRRALAVVRPPGHHAECDRAMGFCFFNNVAVAALVALQQPAFALRCPPATDSADRTCCAAASCRSRLCASCSSLPYAGREPPPSPAAMALPRMAARLLACGAREQTQARDAGAGCGRHRARTRHAEGTARGALRSAGSAAASAAAAAAAPALASAALLSCRAAAMGKTGSKSSPCCSSASVSAIAPSTSHSKHRERQGYTAAAAAAVAAPPPPPVAPAAPRSWSRLLRAAAGSGPASTAPPSVTAAAMPPPAAAACSSGIGRSSGSASAAAATSAGQCRRRKRSFSASNGAAGPAAAAVVLPAAAAAAAAAGSPGAVRRRASEGSAFTSTR
ncbi:Histone deacetylase 4, partial [Tetrabaena socialis]